jgi:hypothetical protein
MVALSHSRKSLRVFTCLTKIRPTLKETKRLFTLMEEKLSCTNPLLLIQPYMIMQQVLLGKKYIQTVLLKLSLIMELTSELKLLAMFRI